MLKVKQLFEKKVYLESKRKSHLIAFCNALKINFSDLILLDQAFHHRSYSNEEHGQRHLNNERLEFLGDSVLGMVTASFLYEDMKNQQEGELSKIKSVVVSEKILAPIARNIGIDKMLILGKGEELSGGRNKDAILADALEALIGAYYLDRGFDSVKKLVLSFIVPEIKKVQENKGQKDYKTLLQEYSQKRFKTCPVYQLVKKTGPDHDRVFWVSVVFDDRTFGPCDGKNKKTAEQNVAKLALQSLEK